MELAALALARTQLRNLGILVPGQVECVRTHMVGGQHDAT